MREGAVKLECKNSVPVCCLTFPFTYTKLVMEHSKFTTVNISLYKVVDASTFPLLKHYSSFCEFI